MKYSWFIREELSAYKAHVTDSAKHLSQEHTGFSFIKTNCTKNYEFDVYCRLSKGVKFTEYIDYPRNEYIIHFLVQKSNMAYPLS